MELADLKDQKIMLAASGGLDSCTIAHWLVEQGVEVVFDYSYTKSSEGDISSFVYDPGDGSNPVTINAADTSEISYTYLTHGMFSAAVGAIDAEGNELQKAALARVRERRGRSHGHLRPRRVGPARRAVAGGAHPLLLLAECVDPPPD